MERIFCVAGESYLDLLDALVDFPEIQLITCRQEGGAGFMAEAHARLTGKPGVCLVTRGPGACNASIGVHTAKQDSAALLLFVGQVARDMMGREAFQEVDYARTFGDLAKDAFQIDRVEEISELSAKAFQTAVSGRPGPVVIALPEDMLCEETPVQAAAPLPLFPVAPSSSDVKKFTQLLESAKRPIVVVGGEGWSEKSSHLFEKFAKAHDLPVVAAFRRQDAFRNTHDCYAGELGTGPNPKLVEKFKTADLVILLGTRFSEITSQSYTLLSAPKPQCKLVHIYPAKEEIGRVYKPDLGIVSDIESFVAALKNDPIKAHWAGWRMELRRDYEEWTTFPDNLNKFAVDMDGIFAVLRERLPRDAIITTDAGNFSGWAQRYLPYDRPRRLLAPTSGAMGYGVPAAVAASIACPDRTVIGLMGDGGFMMTGQEIATAMRYKAKPVLLVFNNNIYGTIRMHQERDYPGRVSATNLTNPDFAKLAQSYGANGVAVQKTADFAPAFDAALKSDKLTLIELRTDPEQITTRLRLSQIGKK